MTYRLRMAAMALLMSAGAAAGCQGHRVHVLHQAFSRQRHVQRSRPRADHVRLLGRRRDQHRRRGRGLITHPQQAYAFAGNSYVPDMMLLQVGAGSTTLMFSAGQSFKLPGRSKLGHVDLHVGRTVSPEVDGLRKLFAHGCAQRSPTSAPPTTRRGWSSITRYSDAAWEYARWAGWRRDMNAVTQRLQRMIPSRRELAAAISRPRHGIPPERDGTEKDHGGRDGQHEETRAQAEGAQVLRHGPRSESLWRTWISHRKYGNAHWRRACSHSTCRTARFPAFSRAASAGCGPEARPSASRSGGISSLLAGF